MDTRWRGESRGEAAAGTVIQRVEWRRYRLPFHQDFTTSQGAAPLRYGAIALVTLRDGHTGTGEVAPLPLYQPAPREEALLPAPELAAELAGQTLGQALGSFDRYFEAAGRPMPASLICGVEMALLDALSQSKSTSLAGTLAGEELARSKPAVPVNAVIGAGDTGDTVRSAAQLVAAGFTCLKLKVGLEPQQVQREIELVTAVRGAIGPEIELRLDANGAWNLEQATAVLGGCLSCDIAYVEQPLPVESLHELPTLRKRTQALIALDEAVTSLSSARRILDAGLADILIVKPQVVGGLLVSRQIIWEAAAHGVECVLTSSIESGIGIAAILQLAAALPQIRRACGLGTLPLLHDDLIVEELGVSKGAISIPGAAGLGVTLDVEALDRYRG